MDLLGEQEVLRNEDLLLLTQLAGGNGDLQKIAVFEGAFERLFGIVRCGCVAGGWQHWELAVGLPKCLLAFLPERLPGLSRSSQCLLGVCHTWLADPMLPAWPGLAWPVLACREEGLLDGDIVVHDCFQLMAALLRGSPPNQLMFRETGFLAQLPPLLRLPERSGAGEGDDFEKLPPGKAANLVAALEVVLALLPQPAAAPGATVCSSQAENRQALLQRGLLDVLVALALQGGGAPDSAVRAQVRHTARDTSKCLLRRLQTAAVGVFCLPYQALTSQETVLALPLTAAGTAVPGGARGRQPHAARPAGGAVRKERGRRGGAAAAGGAAGCCGGRQRGRAGGS